MLNLVCIGPILQQFYHNTDAEQSFYWVQHYYKKSSQYVSRMEMRITSSPTKRNFTLHASFLVILVRCFRSFQKTIEINFNKQNWPVICHWAKSLHCWIPSPFLFWTTYQLLRAQLRGKVCTILSHSNKMFT